MKRAKPIAGQGHTEVQATVLAFVECSQCRDVRLKTSDWKRPCPPGAKWRKGQVFKGDS
jgi:hypothetical protein